MNDTFHCTHDDETAEAYVLRRMTIDEHDLYEEHLLVCPRCQDAVRDFEVFLSSARIALAGDPKAGRRSTKVRAKSASC